MKNQKPNAKALHAPCKSPAPLKPFAFFAAAALLASACQQLPGDPGSPLTDPSGTPSAAPSSAPSATPSDTPSGTPSTTPSSAPTSSPSGTPSPAPSTSPSPKPSASPSPKPTASIPSDLGQYVLDAIATMPTGGAYATTSTAAQHLFSAVTLKGSQLTVNASGATPSFCSEATYLVFLKVISRLQSEGSLTLSTEAATALAPKSQADGVGAWGRWNANGPGTARFFYALGIGRNFTELSQARPGDFMKIFWSSAVGAKETGHSVVFLGTSGTGSSATITYWSSNTDSGYGKKTIPLSRVVNAIFSRLDQPAALSKITGMPTKDDYLASLLSVESSFAEAVNLSGAE